MMGRPGGRGSGPKAPEDLRCVGAFVAPDLRRGEANIGRLLVKGQRPRSPSDIVGFEKPKEKLGGRATQ